MGSTLFYGLWGHRGGGTRPPMPDYGPMGLYVMMDDQIEQTWKSKVFSILHNKSNILSENVIVFQWFKFIGMLNYSRYVSENYSKYYNRTCCLQQFKVTQSVEQFSVSLKVR